MTIEFLGGAGTVTGSKFLVSEDDCDILVDCGLFQGLKQLRLLNWENPDFNMRRLKAVLLTHAHLDHCGFLPLLVKNGFRGPIYCTSPTKEVAKIVLLDSAKIQMEEADYANYKHFSKHSPAKPLYDIEDVEKTLPYFRAIEFNQKFNIENFVIEFKSSGHILGAGSVYVTNSKKQRLLFSGDLGRYNDPLMLPPEPPQEADYVIMESTYGGSLHEGVPSEILQKYINECWQKNSALLIPAFALGRSQNLMYEILQLKMKQKIPASIPIYFNSPMGSEISELYCKYPEYQRINTQYFSEQLAGIRFVRSADDSRELNERKGSAVIISASGMLTGGRVLHHLKAFGQDSRNTILLAGYQALGTRGWSLANGLTRIKIHGAFIDIRAEIIQSNAFSAHADQNDLLHWLSHIPKNPQKIFLVHGEPAASDELRKVIEERFKFKVTAPLLNSIHNL